MIAEDRRKKLGVSATYPEHDQRSRVPYHRGSDRVG